MTENTNPNFQKWFNQAVEGLAAQDWNFSFDRDPIIETIHCLYRSPLGLKCAVGHLLTDAEAERMEGSTPANTKFTVQGNYLSTEEKHFLTRLQRCHDREVQDALFSTKEKELATAKANMRGNLMKFGKDHGLEIPKVLTKAL